jgi:hypothetical protein
MYSAAVNAPDARDLGRNTSKECDARCVTVAMSEVVVVRTTKPGSAEQNRLLQTMFVIDSAVQKSAKDISAMADYYSCKHVSPELISQEVKRVRELTLARKSKLYSSYHCISCEFACAFDRNSFRKHATESQHVVFVRNKEPLELYCIACQDFQFSSVFDKMTKRKRSRTGLTLSSTGKVSPAGAVYGQTKGLCNMGATCFMSSVLQVLMKNTVLMNCDQLQLPHERCKTVVDRSVSIDNSSRLSGDSSGNSAATANANAHCIFCEFKKLSSEANRFGLAVTPPFSP